MSQRDSAFDAPTPLAQPAIRTLTFDDIRTALSRGFDDFLAMPTHAVFLCLLYPLVGLAAARLTLGYAVLPLLFPLAAGFALMGPVAALGLYEMSRRREAGEDVSWQHAFDVLKSPSIGQIAILAGVLAVLFVVWIAVARMIYVAYFGNAPVASISDFLAQVFETRAGWSMIVVGNLVGAVFAAVAFAISAVSFPLLIHRPVNAATAVATSLRVIARSPAVMALWGFIIAASLLAGSLPLFFGLAVVLPVLGHTTWHLYRRAVV